jgi:hypothetical protein
MPATGPVTGEGLATLFCNASKDGSSHRSYCPHHAARSIAVDEPVVFVRPKMVASAWR